MTASIAWFEFKRLLLAPSSYFFLVFFSLLSFFLFLGQGGAFGPVTGTRMVWANSPHHLFFHLSTLYMFATLNVAATVGGSVHRDFELGGHHLFFTKPITKLHYLGGRFSGSLLLILLFSLSGILGAFAAFQSPFVDPTMLGPNRLSAFLTPYLLVIFPNFFIAGSLFFATATLTRKMAPVYVAGAVMLLGYALATEIASDLEMSGLAALMDPLGFSSIVQETKYWSVHQKNHQLMSLTGTLLINRILWIGMGLAVLYLTWRRFSFSHETNVGSEPQTPEHIPVGSTATLKPSKPHFGMGFGVNALLAMARLHFKQTLKTRVFLILLLCAGVGMAVMGLTVDDYMGTATQPVTYMLLELLGGTFALFVLILITFFAGELSWRDRDLQIHGISSALPVPDSLSFVSKFLTLLMMLLFLMGVLMVSCLGIQIFQGHGDFQFGNYFFDLLLVKTPIFLNIAVFALFIHTVVNHKFIGHGLMILFFPATGILDNLGFEHFLYRLFRSPLPVWSDMNGYGHFLEPHFWYCLYWGGLALILGGLSNLMNVRGRDAEFKVRLAEARRRLNRHYHMGLVAAGLIFLSAGGWIYYNTTIRNPYQTSSELILEGALYEKRFGKFEKTPPLKIAGIYSEVDLYPSRRAYKVKGLYQLENRTDQEVDTLLVHLPKRTWGPMSGGYPDQVDVETLELNRHARLVLEDPQLRVRVYRFSKPLQPGENAQLDFELNFQVRGFTNGRGAVRIVENGSFLEGWRTFPTLGYNSRGDVLGYESQRKKHGLKPGQRMASIHDGAARSVSFLGASSDWITYETILSVPKDQTGLAAGTLIRQWTQNDRRYFHYKIDGKMLNYHAYLSGKWAVKRDRWGDVDLEIHHHPQHTRNLDAMMTAAKHSLDYFTRNFGPYQHRYFRIIEFPRYARFAEAFAGTIPFSEAHGFIADVDEASEKDINYPYSITAHEMAHQWWGHQVCPADVQGAGVISETLANYSSLMVMKQKYGEKRMARYLRYELERYLKGRAEEAEAEVPLYLSEGQHYLHYRKGSMAMYALAAYMGEDAVNRALARLVEKFSFAQPPYPTTFDLVGFLEAEAPDHLKYLVREYFKEMVFYDLKTREATARPLDGGFYEVTLSVEAQKTRADGAGAETTASFEQDLFQIGVLDENGDVLHREMVHLKEGPNVFTYVVSRKPGKAGLDPLGLLIDRKPEDNVREVRWETM